MIQQAIAKQAVQTFVGNAQEEAAQRDRQEIIEIQNQHRPQERKYWWSRRAPNDAMLTAEERKLLKKVKSRAKFLDRGLSCCCCSIGFDAIVGFIPVFGDFIGLLLAVQLVHTCMEAQLPDELVSRMMLNVAIDFVIGLVPLLGDMLDIMFKCNSKNALLFEHYLYKRRDIYLRENLESGSAPLLSEYKEPTNVPPAMKYNERYPPY